MGEKYRKRSDSRPVVAADCEARMVFVPRSNGKHLKVAYEDILHAVQSDLEVALLVQSAIDVCSSYFQDAVDENAARSLEKNKAN